MVKDSGLESLQQRAAEMVLSSSSLTDDLTDEEARPLIAWAVAQAEAVAREMAVVGARGAEPDAIVPDPIELLGDRLTPVRKLMRAVSSLAADRHRLDAEAVAEEIDYVFELAHRLPGGATRPRVAPAGTGQPAPLVERHAELDNKEFVLALLDRLPQPAAPPAAAAPDEDAPAGQVAPKAHILTLPRSFASTTRDPLAGLGEPGDIRDTEPVDRSDDDDAEETQQST